MLFEKVNAHFQKKLPFVIYCKPNSNKIIGLFQRNNTLFELGEQAGFCFVSFDNKKKYIIPEAESDLYFQNSTDDKFYFDSITKNDFNVQDKIHFKYIVNKAVEEIKKGAFEKVVLSRKETFSIQNFNIEVVFRRMISQYHSAFNYCLYHPQVGLWLAATPEQFLKVDNDKLKTVALAGTRVKTENIDWSEKEINEQKIVSDFIIENLKNVTSAIQVSEVYNQDAGELVHLKTDIEAIVTEDQIPKIIDLLHPTPAVCGLPKEISKQFIINYEGYDRMFYSGYCGEWKKDFLSFEENQFDLFVNLRCMNVIENKITIFVGCGITFDSDAEKEFIETVNKSLTMKKVL